MDIRTQSALLAAIVAAALGISMLLRANRPRVLSFFGSFSISVALFYLARFLSSFFDDPHFLAGRITLGASLVTGAFVPSVALSFFLEFLNFSPRTAKWGRRVSYMTVVIGFLVAVTPLATMRWARFAVAAWVFAALISTLSLLIARMRRSEIRIERLRLLYLAIGAALAVAFSALDYLEAVGVAFPSLGPFVTTLYLFLLSQTLLRLRLMDLHELLGKAASQTVLGFSLAAVFVLLTVWATHNKALYVFNSVVAAFVLSILLEPFREQIDERVTALFFRERFNFLASIQLLVSRSANIIDVQELAQHILDGLNETRRITHASLYILAEDRPGFRLLDARGPTPVSFIDAASARGILNRSERVFILETTERRIAELRQQYSEARKAREETKKLQDIRSALQLLKAGITIPLLGNERTIGFLNLWDERVPEAFASDELQALQSLAQRFSTAFENSKLYDRIRERDRLAALGEMAAGLAHEIRNPLGAIKGAAQCLDPKKIPAEDSEFVEVIVDEVNRLNGVVTAFLDYARPLKQNFGATDINEVVSRTLKLLQNDWPENIKIEVALEQPLPSIDGDAEQLRQVVINLLQNARQALGRQAGQISIKTSKLERYSHLNIQDFVEIVVSDSGPGIPVEQQQNVFVPFFTTKEKGTGLGLAICQRIIKNHQGSISLSSRVGEGASFTIRLPARVSETPDAAVVDTAVDTQTAASTAEDPFLPSPKRGKEKRRRR